MKLKTISRHPVRLIKLVLCWVWNNLFPLMQLAVAIAGVILILAQLKQVNEHKKWENYNEMNKRYSDWYSDLSSKMSGTGCTMTVKMLGSARRYFDLYSEERWLYEHRLIPREMYTVRIANGAMLNLEMYPLLARGYRYWKEKGAFQHPAEFIEMMDYKIDQLEKAGKLKLAYCPNGLNVTPD